MEDGSDEELNREGDEGAPPPTGTPTEEDTESLDGARVVGVGSSVGVDAEGARETCDVC
jgi:hypothetical protein